MKVLETDRLVLSEATVADAPFILTLVNDAEWLTFLDNRGITTLAEAELYVLNTLCRGYLEWGFGLYLVTLKGSMVPIGVCGLLKREYLEFADIGFGFLSDYCGMGYAGESAKGVMAYGKNTLGLKTILAIVDPHHQKSIKLLHKIGLRFSRSITSPVNGSALQVYA